jgi:hypothetical protein
MERTDNGRKIIEWETKIKLRHNPRLASTAGINRGPLRPDMLPSNMLTSCLTLMMRFLIMLPSKIGLSAADGAIAV